MSDAREAPLAEDAPFEKILDRLRNIVDKLEEGDLPLEQSLQVFEEGIRLSRLGARRLDAAEKRIEELLQGEDEQGNPRTGPAETGAAAR